MRDVIWVASSRRDLIKMPKRVVENFGYALYQAQIGAHPDKAKPLKGFSGTEVLELIDNFKSDTFRAVYTVRFEEVIVVLHVFQKKARREFRLQNERLTS